MSRILLIIRLVALVTPTCTGFGVGWLLNQVLPFKLFYGALTPTLGGLGLAAGLSFLLWTRQSTVGLDERMDEVQRRTAAHAYPLRLARLYFYFSLTATSAVLALGYLEHQAMGEILVSAVLTYLLATPPVLLMYLGLRRLLRPIAEGLPGADPIIGERQTLRMRLLFAVQVPVVTCAVGLVLIEHQSNLGYEAEIRAYHDSQRAGIERQLIALGSGRVLVQTASPSEPDGLFLHAENDDVDWVALLTLCLFVLLSSMFGRWLTRDVTSDLESIEATLRTLPHTSDRLNRPNIGLRETADLARALDQAISGFETQREQIQAAAEDRRRAEQEKATFLAHVSHELKSPLNSILGFSELLLAEIDGPIDEAQRVRIGEIWLRGDRLLRYILGLLDVARLDGFRVSQDDEEEPAAARKSTKGSELFSALRDQRRPDPLARTEVKLVTHPDVDQTTTGMDPVQTARAMLLLAGTLTDALQTGSVTIELRANQQTRLTVELRVDQGRLDPSAQKRVMRAWSPLLHRSRTGPTIETDGIPVRLLQLLEEVQGGDIVVEARGNSPQLILLCSTTA